jgi:hypothetical protein
MQGICSAIYNTNQNVVLAESFKFKQVQIFMTWGFISIKKWLLAVAICAILLTSVFGKPHKFIGVMKHILFFSPTAQLWY